MKTLRRSNPTERSACRQRRDEGEGGFTLLELLVVLIILSLVAGIAAPRVLGYLSEARVRAAKLQIEALTSAFDLFYLDVARYPTEREGLDALVDGGSIKRWKGPYIQTASVPLDPWGNPYQYRMGDKGRPQIISYGADGVEGGADGAADIAIQQ
ncbi:type II secretion system major pseudopilin GspG [Ensifer sp. HO-A22]|uniref:Type II secretion system core protein G n=1 Tax=Ensifer oleiphilus TaxID=2742698 RepID=A0A7Y6QBK8_9HYPH|nr:type II secretion system major pseudopilin GspG [Ensifer oleiphilus]NVD42650.1 type II secretion system major pseudopilin GspG [Ensifer oleiphilus]